MLLLPRFLLCKQLLSENSMNLNDPMLPTTNNFDKFVPTWQHQLRLPDCSNFESNLGLGMPLKWLSQNTLYLKSLTSKDKETANNIKTNQSTNTFDRNPKSSSKHKLPTQDKNTPTLVPTGNSLRLRETETLPHQHNPILTRTLVSSWQPSQYIMVLSLPLHIIRRPIH